MSRRFRIFNLQQLTRAEQREVSRSIRELGSLWTTADAVVESYGLIADAIEAVAFSAGPTNADHARHQERLDHD